MAHEFDMLVVLNEIRDLLKKQNEILSLPFGIGYKSQEGTSNMSISIKLK